MRAGGALSPRRRRRAHARRPRAPHPPPRLQLELQQGPARTRGDQSHPSGSLQQPAEPQAGVALGLAARRLAQQRPQLRGGQLRERAPRRAQARHRVAVCTGGGVGGVLGVCVVWGGSRQGAAQSPPAPPPPKRIPALERETRRARPPATHACHARARSPCEGDPTHCTHCSTLSESHTAGGATQRRRSAAPPAPSSCTCKHAAAGRAVEGWW